jgi:hypothetical protein
MRRKLHWPSFWLGWTIASFLFKKAEEETEIDD